MVSVNISVFKGYSCLISLLFPYSPGLEKAIEFFRRVLEESGEIIPTGPGAAKPKEFAPAEA